MLMPAAGEFKKIHDVDTNFVSLEDFFNILTGYYLWNLPSILGANGSNSGQIGGQVGSYDQ